MRKRVSSLIKNTVVFCALLSINLFGQEPILDLWQNVDRSFLAAPENFRAVTLNQGALKQILSADNSSQLRNAFSATKEESPTEPFEIMLPMPDGTLARFLLTKSSVMEPELEARFPEIKTFSGQGLDDPLASVQFDFSPSGVHAQILSPDGAIYIEPSQAGETNFYFAYYKRDLLKAEEFACLVPLVEEASASSTRQLVEKAAPGSGSVVRSYRLAVAASGEYTAFHGGTVASAMSAIVTTINRINGIYENDLGIHLNLVANNDQIIFTSASSDPYSVNDPTTTTMVENQNALDRIIGPGNYDLGIVFNTGSAGVAQIRSVCVNQYKGHACIGSPNPTGDAFWVGYVAHEIGHMFGAEHTFNSVSGHCGGNRSMYAAYEPGGGSTVMAYAGLCAGDSFQSQADPYFHIISIDQIGSFITGSGNSCATLSGTGNTPPHVHASSGFTIPKGTPFKLTAGGNDNEGDPILYCWEEFDLGPAQSLGAADNGSSPLFRSFPPTTNPTRIFPRMEDILRNRLSAGERLPNVSRVMEFRVTARDNRPGGGLESSRISVSVDGGAGPFAVTAPAPSEKWFGLRAQEIRWDVANTSSSPVNAGTVNILLSTDGGVNFNVVLAANTPNDGSETVVFPNTPIGRARIKVEAANNIFFAVSGEFSIQETLPPTITLKPQSQNVLLTDVTFTTAAAGTPPFNYQWQFNEVDIPGANSATYVFNVSSIDQSGFYRVRISNAAGEAVSENAELVVVAELVKPTVSLASGLPFRITNGTTTVQGTASDNAAVREVRWRVNDDPFQRALGTTTWTASPVFVAGTNRFEVVSVDTSGNLSLPVTHDFFYVVMSRLSLVISGGGDTKPGLNGEDLEVGTRYKIVAKADRGQVFAGWSGGIEATEPELQFLMQSNLVLQANFVPNPFGKLKGNYAGLFFETNEVRYESSGFFSLKTTDKGSFSGTLFLAGKRLPLTGAFNGVGATTKSIRIGKTNTLTASLLLDVSNNTDTVSGTIRNETWVAALAGGRSAFSRTSPAPQSGKYTAVLRPDFREANAPAGSGFATLTVNESGALRMAGALADGTRITQSTTVSSVGEWPLYASLYQNKGSLLGWVSDSGTNGLSGLVRWIKPSGVKGNHFPLGFTNDTVFLGSRYESRGRSPVLTLTNGVVTFSDGNLSPLMVDVNLNHANKISAVPSAAKLTVTLNVASGTIAGNFVHPETHKKTTFKGVVIQGQEGAEGFFLGTNQSGTVRLEKK